ncbi:hypothetical protein K7432_004318 [Basidiobolus ranarum]|uniref:Uncharacterized protein n=1 Tax=Basidiobolus ranarum TaxID=34480 RepID=A0ABR2W4T2_9FUNG
MPNFLSLTKRSDTSKKLKPPKAIPLTQENLLAHNTQMPPAKESKRARVVQYVSLQSSFSDKEEMLHSTENRTFRPPSIHSLEDLPNPQQYFSKDLDDSVSMIGRRRRKARLRLWFNRIVRTLKHFVPKMGKTHTYPSQQIV